MVCFLNGKKFKTLLHVALVDWEMLVSWRGLRSVWPML